MSLQGQGGPAQVILNPLADKLTGMAAANGTMVALVHRAPHGGKGQRVMINMTAAYSSFLLFDHMNEHTFQSVDLPAEGPMIEVGLSSRGSAATPSSPILIDNTSKWGPRDARI